MGFKIFNRRYTGSKAKLSDWIMTLTNKHCKGDVFTDIFAGTGVVSSAASKHFKRIIINDFLYSNYSCYKAFFEDKPWNKKKVIKKIKDYNAIDSSKLKDNYFSKYFGNKYFSVNDAKKIGFIRDDIEKNKISLKEKEYYILLTSLLYSVDTIANTVGHYDAYIQKLPKNDRFLLQIIEPETIKNLDIFREDSNKLARKIVSDVVYIDPPYNSRQYSRFYHLLETLIKWDKQKLYGVALKPMPENMSNYCKIAAKDSFRDLINNLKCKYIVVSYNNTYHSKSNSSKNKISLKDIETILKNRGKTHTYTKAYKYFNSGKTHFDNHEEYLFITDLIN